jgi:hypothetical protein
MSSGYLEHSRDVVAALDPQEVGGLPLGDVTYRNNFFARHALGAVEMDGAPLYLAADLPVWKCNAQMLLLANLEQILRMLEVAPDMAEHAPSFVGAVASGEESAY